MTNKSISQLNAGVAIAGTDLFPDVQTAGVGPVKVTALQIGTYVLTGVYDSGFVYTPASDDLRLGVPASSQGSLTLANSSGGGYTATIKSSNSTSATWTLTLPVTAGTAGYMFVTDGSGNSSWTNALPAAATGVSLTLGTQGGAGPQGSLVLANTGSGAVTIQSSNSTSAAWTMTLPASAGSNGYIMTTNGSGVTAWTNPTALGIDIDVGTTPITNGTVGRILFEGSGNVIQESANLTFSTAALTLGVQQTAQGSIVLANTAAGAYGVTVQSSNSATAGWTMTLPVTAGTSGYVLTTNGSGVTSWATIGGAPTGFTQGSVVFAGASGVLAQNNSKFFWDDANYRLGVNTASPAVSIVVNATDAIRVPVGTQGERPTGATGYIRYNTDSGKFEGYGASSWGSIGGGAAITDDTTTNATEYPVFSSSTTGDLTTAYVSSTKLTYNPSTGNLISTAVGSSSGVLVNSNNITASYSIPSGYNGITSGPVTIAGSATITVPAGSNWTVV